MYIRFDPLTNTYKKIHREANFVCSVCHTKYIKICGVECGENFLLYKPCPICNSYNTKESEYLIAEDVSQKESDIIQKCVSNNMYAIHILDSLFKED